MLGAISPNDQGGQQNFHQVDNVSGVDFLVFQFDKAVTLDSISREGVAAGSGRPATRSNVSLGYGNSDSGSLDLASLLGIVNGGLTTIEGPIAEGTLPGGGDEDHLRHRHVQHRRRWQSLVGRGGLRHGGSLRLQAGDARREI